MNLRKRLEGIADYLTRVLHIDARFYGKTFSLFTLAHSTMILRGLASTYFVSRIVEPEVFGQMRYMIAIYGISGIFTFSGYSISLVKGLAKGDFFVVRRIFKRVLLFSPIGSIFLSLFAIDRLIVGEVDVAVSIFISALFFVPYTLCGAYVQIYTGQQKINELTRANIWSNILYAVLFTATMLWSHNLIVISLAYFLIDVVVRGWFTWSAYRELPPSTEEHEGYDTLGLQMNRIYIMQSLTAAVGQILLQRFWGYRAMASFSVAMIIPEQVISLMKTMNGTLLQRFSRYKEVTEGHIKNVQKQFRLSILMMLAMFVAYAVVAPFVIPFFFPQYPDAVLPSIVYALGFFSVAIMIGTNVYQAYGKMKTLWILYISTSTIQLILSMILVPLFGGWGAIWSQVITRFSGIPLIYPRMSNLLDKESSKS